VGWFAGHGDRSGVKLVNECLGVNDVQLTVVCLYRIQRDVVDSLEQENIVVRFVGEYRERSSTQREGKAARLD
jgi:hypothetical protein